MSWSFTTAKPVIRFFPLSFIDKNKNKNVDSLQFLFGISDCIFVR